MSPSESASEVVAQTQERLCKVSARLAELREERLRLLALPRNPRCERILEQLAVEIRALDAARTCAVRLRDAAEAMMPRPRDTRP